MNNNQYPKADVPLSKIMEAMAAVPDQRIIQSESGKAIVQKVSNKSLLEKSNVPVSEDLKDRVASQYQSGKHNISDKDINTINNGYRQMIGQQEVLLEETKEVSEDDLMIHVGNKGEEENDYIAQLAAQTKKTSRY